MIGFSRILLLLLCAVPLFPTHLVVSASGNNGSSGILPRFDIVPPLDDSSLPDGGTTHRSPGPMTGEGDRIIIPTFLPLMSLTASSDSAAVLDRKISATVREPFITYVGEGFSCVEKLGAGATDVKKFMEELDFHNLSVLQEISRPECRALFDQNCRYLTPAGILTLAKSEQGESILASGKCVRNFRAFDTMSPLDIISLPGFALTIYEDIQVVFSPKLLLDILVAMDFEIRRPEAFANAFPLEYLLDESWESHIRAFELFTPDFLQMECTAVFGVRHVVQIIEFHTKMTRFNLSAEELPDLNVLLAMGQWTVQVSEIIAGIASRVFLNEGIWDNTLSDALTHLFDSILVLREFVVVFSGMNAHLESLESGAKEEYMFALGVLGNLLQHPFTFFTRSVLVQSQANTGLLCFRLLIEGKFDETELTKKPNQLETFTNFVQFCGLGNATFAKIMSDRLQQSWNRRLLALLVDHHNESDLVDSVRGYFSPTAGINNVELVRWVRLACALSNIAIVDHFIRYFSSSNFEVEQALADQLNQRQRLRMELARRAPSSMTKIHAMLDIHRPHPESRPETLLYVDSRYAILPKIDEREQGLIDSLRADPELLARSVKRTEINTFFDSVVAFVGKAEFLGKHFTVQFLKSPGVDGGALLSSCLETFAVMLGDPERGLFIQLGSGDYVPAPFLDRNVLELLGRVHGKMLQASITPAWSLSPKYYAIMFKRPSKDAIKQASIELVEDIFKQPLDDVFGPLKKMEVDGSGDVVEFFNSAEYPDKTHYHSLTRPFRLGPYGPSPHAHATTPADIDAYRTRMVERMAVGLVGGLNSYLTGVLRFIDSSYSGFLTPELLLEATAPELLEKSRLIARLAFKPSCDNVRTFVVAGESRTINGREALVEIIRRMPDRLLESFLYFCTAHAKLSVGGYESLKIDVECSKKTLPSESKLSTAHACVSSMIFVVNDDFDTTYEYFIESIVGASGYGLA